jgi:hypothetical protein
MCICHFSLLSSPKSFFSTWSLVYGINHKFPHIIHRVFVRGVEELSISHSVVEFMYRAVRCLCSDLAFVHSRFVIASVPQTSLEISLLFLVFVLRCFFDALVAGSSCRSINKKGSFVNSYVDTTLCVWIWTRQTIFFKKKTDSLRICTSRWCNSSWNFDPETAQPDTFVVFRSR